MTQRVDPKRFVTIDDELSFWPDYAAAEGIWEEPVWHISHDAVLEENGDWFNSILIPFARRRDVELAIKALRNAGMTTARKMWADLEKRKQIIAEAMAW